MRQRTFVDRTFLTHKTIQILLSIRMATAAATKIERTNFAIFRSRSERSPLDHALPHYFDGMRQHFYFHRLKMILHLFSLEPLNKNFFILWMALVSLFEQICKK